MIWVRNLLSRFGSACSILKPIDTWFEEDTPIYQHPKDPYKRIDILPSSRKISIKIDGLLIAESTTNMFLFETMLRPRYYMPKTSVIRP